MNVKMNNLNSWHNQCIAISQQSHDTQTKVGAILIKNSTKSIVSQGYNGFVRGACDVKIPNTRPEKYPYMIHAEMNLIFNCALNGINMHDCSVYCTLSPCEMCTRSLFQCGIRDIYFKDFYKTQTLMDISSEIKNIGDYKHLHITPTGEEIGR